ncbi:MAG: hypothetical protein ACFCUM_05700 [Bacteroidales bacterium]
MRSSRLLSIFSITLCLVTTVEVRLKAQPFFEDARGKASIHLPVGGIARINTADESLKFGYYFNRSDKDLVFGMDASGRSTNGLASIFSDDKLLPEATLNFNLGFKNVSTDNSSLSGFDYLHFRLGLGTAKYTLIKTENTFDGQISSETFNKINIGLSYNYFLNGNMIFGVYGGYDKTNNINELRKIKIIESFIISDDPSGTIIRSSELEYTAWRGELKRVNQFSLFFDYVYIPDFINNRVAMSVYSRSGFNNNRNNTNGGFGIYFNKEGEPLKIIGGLIYEFDDLFDAGKTGSKLGQRGTIGIVAGYNF